MKTLLALVAAVSTAMWAVPASAQCGGAPGPGEIPAGGAEGYRTPGHESGSSEGGSVKRSIRQKRGEKKPPELVNFPVALQYVPHESKKCDCLQRALSKVAGVSNLVMGDGNIARMNFTGDWDEMIGIEFASWNIRCKANLIEPSMFAIDFAAERTTSTKALMDALEKTPGVQKAFIEAGRLYVFSRLADVDPRVYQQIIRDAGLRYIATRSHRLRSLSYEAWDSKSSLNVLRETLLKTTGVLRVDIDEKNKQVHVVLIRETSKDPAIVTAAEEACFTLYPGKAEPDDEDEPKGNIPTDTK